MGRGRQKAKQTKVARDLKYQIYEPNYDQLQRELSGGRSAVDTEDAGDADPGAEADWNDDSGDYPSR